MTTIDLFTTATCADLRLAMMQAGYDGFTVTALGVEVDCDCSMGAGDHTIRPSAWVEAVEENDGTELVDVDGLWFRTRVGDAIRRDMERGTQEAFHPLTREALQEGVREYEE